jgi:hypothetical protein
VTADEDNWMRRAGGFAWGVANGRPGRTYQNGHPGVLTMELAILGQGPGGAERFADPVTGNPRLVTTIPGFFDGLVDARRAFALATAGLVTAISLVAWRLFGPGPAIFGGLLLALDPFYLAHSQLVHLDALLSGCLTLAVLCGLVRWGRNGDRRWVIAGGAFSGLALLAKVPAIYLLPFVPLLALMLGRQLGLRRLTVDLVHWGLAGLLAFVALWPSLWVNPVSTIERMVEFARETGGQPHEQGSFFLGQALADPGPLFYPVAVALRLAPATIVGLLVLALVAWRAPRTLSPSAWRLVIALAAFAVGFALFMSLGAKKFDRYLLPAFPTLDLLAGLGLWLGWRWLRFAPLAAIQMRRRALPLALGTALVAAVAWPALSVYPHYLAYYNPLAGGGAAAVRSIPVGEGEGLREVGEWLNAQPDLEQLEVISDSYDVLKAVYAGGGESLRDRVPPSADYVVLYVYQTQINHSPRVRADYASREPEHVVGLNGIEYARIFRGPGR